MDSHLSINSEVVFPEERVIERKKQVLVLSYNPSPLLFSRSVGIGLETDISSCSCTKILVVDDNGFNIYALQQLLSLDGLKSDSAKNGQEAIEQIKNKLKMKRCRKTCVRGYPLIFMDCNMPVLDGYEATVRIKKFISKKLFPPSYIVAQTAYAFNEGIQKIFKAGMDEYIPKPLALKKIREVVNRVLC